MGSPVRKGEPQHATTPLRLVPDVSFRGVRNPCKARRKRLASDSDLLVLLLALLHGSPVLVKLIHHLDVIGLERKGIPFGFGFTGQDIIERSADQQLIGAPVRSPRRDSRAADCCISCRRPIAER